MSIYSWLTGQRSWRTSGLLLAALLLSAASGSQAQPAPYGGLKTVPISVLPLDTKENAPYLVDFQGAGDRYYAALAQRAFSIPGASGISVTTSFVLLEFDRSGYLLSSRSISGDFYGQPEKTGLYVNGKNRRVFVGLITLREDEALGKPQMFDDVYEAKGFSLERIATLSSTDYSEPAFFNSYPSDPFGGCRGLNDADEYFVWCNSTSQYRSTLLAKDGTQADPTNDFFIAPSDLAVLADDGRALHLTLDGTFRRYDPVQREDLGFGTVWNESPIDTGGVQGVFPGLIAGFYAGGNYAIVERAREQQGPLGGITVARYAWPATPLGPATTLFHSFDYSSLGSMAIGGDGSVAAAFLGNYVNLGGKEVNVSFVSAADAHLGTHTITTDGMFRYNFGVALLDNGDAMVITLTRDENNTEGSDAIVLQAFIHPECGNGVLEPGNSEQCDDGNAEELDGCASDCTFQGCGDGVLDTGEDCDDGNRTNGDSCSSQCRDEESVDTTVGAGGTAHSDTELDGATPADPLETAVTVPAGGHVTILETDDDGAPVGYTGIGKKVVISVTPSGTVANPLEITFTADPSIIPPGETASTVQVFRNGARVLGCTGAPSAVPDPCISSVQAVGDDVALTVLTSAASTWELGFACGDGNVNASVGEECDDGNTVAGDGCSSSCLLEAAQDKGQVKCMTTLTKSVENVAKTQAKINSGCVKNASKEKVGDALACLLADEKDKVGKAKSKLAKNVVKRCVDDTVPDFGFYDQEGAGADLIWQDFLASLIGNPSTNVVLASADKAAAKCQQSLLKAADQHALTIFKEFGKCVKAGLKSGSDTPPAIQSADGVAACILADPKGKIAKSLSKLGQVRPKKCDCDRCGPVDLSVALGGDCATETGEAFDACVATRANCAACRVASLAHQLSIDCDIVDDGLNNQTCSE